MATPRRRAPSAADDPAEALARLWQRGQRPDLRAFLAGVGALPPAQLLAVVRVDLQRRWEAGDRVPAETYLRDYPALQADQESALVLVYGEFLLREQRGEAPSTLEYLCRFPQYADALRLQFDLHRALDEDDSPAGVAPPLPKVPGHELLEELGRGATSVVYKAWQTTLRRVVAVKVVRADVRVGRPERARFRAEGEAVARLQHPNVVQVYDIGESGGRPYLVLEYVEGGTLAGRLARGPVPVAEAVALVETLARAIHHVHQRGIVHRDLNPANVLLAACGLASSLQAAVPKITDFGLAKLLVGGVGLTRTGAVLGTPAYMAPEQADGRSKDVGPATDVYALGAILYHLLTGRPPYDEGGQLATLLKVRSAEPPPAVRQLRPEVSLGLEAVCLRCLAKEPADRPATAQALADLLAGLRPAPLPTAYLVVEATGAEFTLRGPVTLLGRSRECDVRLSGTGASRRHCRILLGPDGLTLEDLGSTRGTRVNGRRVRGISLRDGDRIDVGGQTFEVRTRPPGG